jgi:hypothetical protein
MVVVAGAAMGCDDCDFQMMEVFPSTQRHYRRLILLLNTTYTATCFGRTTILKQKYIINLKMVVRPKHVAV